MRFQFAASIVALAILVCAAPRESGPGTGMVIPIAKRNLGLVKGDQSVDFARLDSHIASSVAKIRRGFANIERNTGLVHHAAVNRERKRANTSGAGEALADVNSELWYGTISIGTPPQSFTVAFGTASGDLIVGSTACDTSCDGHSIYNPASSSTAQDLGRTFNLKYGDGSSTSGEQYTETVSIAGFTATTQTFGAAKTYSTGLQSNFFPPDGVMGMGYQALSAYNASPVMQTLVAEGQINPVFSFHLLPSGGELFIGGTNSALYTGDFTYVSITTQGYWEVYMDYMMSNGQELGNDIDCIIDTGTTAIVVPDASWIYSVLGGTPASSYGQGYYTLPCNSIPSVELYFGGVSFPISAASLNLGPVTPGSSDCLGGIVENPNVAYWILGDVFLQNVYTTFDLGNNQVGFAQLA